MKIFAKVALSNCLDDFLNDDAAKAEENGRCEFLTKLVLYQIFYQRTTRFDRESGVRRLHF